MPVEPPRCPTCDQPASQALAGPAHGWECRNEACTEYGQLIADDERRRRVSALLHEAAETHHVVYRITDGADDGWASFYADWLTRLSELGDVLGTRPVRSQLVHELVECERSYARAESAGGWEDWYAERLLARFG
jgi:hypothetical protein